MKIAICFSGAPTRIEECFTNIKGFFDQSFDDYDVYGYFPELGNSFEVERHFNFKQKEILFEKDTHISTKGFSIHRPVQQYLQQIYGYKKCFEMVKKSNKEYDFIIRCRPDILFPKPYYKITDLQKDILYIPNFHNHGGCNDRFAVGSPNIIKYYMNVFDFVMSNQRTFYNAEEILATCLASYNVKIKFIPLRFTRIRKDQSADEDFERTTRAKHTRYPKNLMVA